MSQVTKTPEQQTQEYASSSNSSTSKTDNAVDSTGIHSVELQSIGTISQPNSEISNAGGSPSRKHLPSQSLGNVSQPGYRSDRSVPHDGVNSPPLPRWYRVTGNEDEHTFIKFLRKTRLIALWYWVCGPSPPRSITFKPLFPRWQSLPTRYLSKWGGKHTGELIFVILCFILWLIVFSVLMANSAIGSIQGDSDQPLRMYCTASLWSDAPTCGIDGKNCEPFDGQPFPFLCPSNCLAAQILNPYTVGDEEVIYQPLVIGGPNTTDDGIPIYRGDSFICASAIHAGIISNQRGGCGLLTRQGERKNFPSADSNGIASIGFPSSFPQSFTVTSIDANCGDPQWSVLAVSVVFTALISLVVTSAAVFTAIIFVIVFFQIGLITSAPNYMDFPEVLSTEFSRFLPAIFIVVVLYRYCIRRTLKGIQAPWERTILWMGGCWVGAMNDYTFDHIPIQRLTSHDLKQQPGAIVALIVIVLVIVAIAIGQIWFYRLEGRLPRYLAFYVCIGVIIGCLTSIPSLEFRLHHYILALLLLPGTALQTRPSMLYQGLLFGLFINGVARWGFASILQTPAALLSDAQTGSALPTDILHDIVSNTITFNFTQLADGYDGMSVLVNDVERYQQSRLELPASFNWTRADPDEPLFFRFAFTLTYRLGGVYFGDYTKPGIWYPNGTWHEMLPGPSR